MPHVQELIDILKRGTYMLASFLAQIKQSPTSHFEHSQQKVRIVFCIYIDHIATHRIALCVVQFSLSKTLKRNNRVAS